MLNTGLWRLSFMVKLNTTKGGRREAVLGLIWSHTLVFGLWGSVGHSRGRNTRWAKRCCHRGSGGKMWTLKIMSHSLKTPVPRNVLYHLHIFKNRANTMFIFKDISCSYLIENDPLDNKVFPHRQRQRRGRTWQDRRSQSPWPRRTHGRQQTLWTPRAWQLFGISFVTAAGIRQRKEEGLGQVWPGSMWHAAVLDGLAHPEEVSVAVVVQPVVDHHIPGAIIVGKRSRIPPVLQR